MKKYISKEDEKTPFEKMQDIESAFRAGYMSLSNGQPNFPSENDDLLSLIDENTDSITKEELEVSFRNGYASAMRSYLAKITK